jgi:parvulin-like peptidyl-prolyl isomerase
MDVTMQQRRLTTVCMRSTTRTLLAAAMVLGLLASAAAAGEPSGAEGAETQIVARVNGESVTRGELQRLLLDPVSQRRLQQELGVQMADSKAVDRLAVQTLIHRHLMLQEARRRNISVTEKDHDQALLDLRRRFKDLKEFGAWMHARGLNDKSLQDTVRIDILMTRVRAALLDEVRVTKKEVQKYYEAHKEDVTTAERVRLRIIAVKDKAAADEIVAALRIGADFGSLARKRSLGVRAKQGGDTGWVSVAQVPPPLRETVANLKVGENSGPVQSGEHFLLVRLQGRQPSRTKSLADVQPAIERRLLTEKQQEVLQTWLAEQEKKAKIEVLL